MQLDALEADDVFRRRWRRRLAADLGAADGRVLPQLDVGVLRVVREADVAG